MKSWTLDDNYLLEIANLKPMSSWKNEKLGSITYIDCKPCEQRSTIKKRKMF